MATRIFSQRKLDLLQPTLDDGIRKWFPTLYERAAREGRNSSIQSALGPQDLGIEDNGFLGELVIAEGQRHYPKDPVWRTKGYSRARALEAMMSKPELMQLFTIFQCYYVNICNFTRFGQKVYYFSPSLVERLAHTELNVATELIKLPFSSCLFVFDDIISREAYARLTSSLSHAQRALRLGLPISSYVSYLQPPPAGGTLWCFSAMPDRRKAQIVTSRAMQLSPNQRVEDALLTRWTEAEDKGEEQQSNIPRSDSSFSGDALLFYRIILNGILYLSSNHPDISPLIRSSDRVLHQSSNSGLHGSQSVTRRSTQSSRLAYIEVGANLPALSHPAGGALTGRLLVQRHLVRGHWRSRQHYGPGRSLTKPVFIEPYWRGPDAAEIINRPYVVTLGDLDES